HGPGTFGSRSIAVGGSALDGAARKVLAKARRLAAHVMEAAEPDVEFRDGTFRVVGTNRQVRFAEVARAAHLGHNLPDGVEPGLQESRSEEHTSELQSRFDLVCRLLLEKKKNKKSKEEVRPIRPNF